MNKKNLPILLIGAAVLLFAFKKPAKKKTSVIVPNPTPANNDEFTNGFQNLLNSFFNRKPTQSEAEQIKNNWKNFKIY